MKQSLLIGIICLVGYAMVSCQLREANSQAIRPIGVEVLPMTKQTTISRHTFVGEIEEKNSVSLSAQSAGRILSVNTDRGNHISEGQLLLTIDSTQALNARESAAALLLQAEDGYARAMALYKEGGISEQKRIELETKLTQARAMYASAARAVEECTLCAPVAGVIGECRAKVGETVVPGLPLLTIINMDGFMVRFSVPENEIASIRIGADAHMSVPAIQTDNIALKITDKSFIPNKIAHTYEVVAAIQGSYPLLPGMMAKVTLDADCVSGFVLPQSCIQMLPDGAKVWVAEQGKAVRRTITIGQYVNDGVLITDGIGEGDSIIIKGYQKLWQSAEITY